MRQLFYYNMRQKFITKCVMFFLQNATVLLQNATVITNYDDFITKRDSYYKMRHLLQIATVQCVTGFSIRFFFYLTETESRA